MRGFSFIEVIFALGLSVAVLAAVGSLVAASRLGDASRDQDLALVSARGELEKLRQGGYAGLPSSGSYVDSQLSLLPRSAGTVTVTAPSATVKQVVVTVTWVEKAQRSLSLTTLIAQTGGLP